MRACAIALALCAVPALGGPGAKPETPDRALKRVIKAFAKLDGYRAEATIRGGIARGAEHRVSAPVVDDRYALSARGKLLRLEGPLLGFRLRGRVDGAVQVDQRWKKLLAPAEGRRMTRLCSDPEALLAEALRLRRGARYADEGTRTGPGDVLTSVAGDADEGTRTGRRGDGSADRAAEAVARPRHIVIEAEGQLAVQHFERVLSSGCLLGGG